MTKNELTDYREITDYLLGRVFLFDYYNIDEIISDNNIKNIDELLELYPKLIEQKSIELKEAEEKNDKAYEHKRNQ